jgi:hypothetical protein
VRAYPIFVAILCTACAAEDPPPRARDPFGIVPSTSKTPARIGPFPLPATASSATLESKPAESSTAKPEAPHPESPPSVCPPEMVLVHGDHCTEVRQDCLEWLDPDIPPFPRKRCKRFAPSVCTGKKKHLRFCIDRYENASTETALPTSDVSWTLAKQSCEAAGKRLCNEGEWVFACEGEELRPYPTGYVRNASICNFDREDLVDEKGHMRDYREPANANQSCESPFGVRNMVGNVDEWTWIDGSNNKPWRAALKGGWWLAGRNRCRPATTGHDEFYHDLQTGFRCCKEAP